MKYIIYTLLISLLVLYGCISSESNIRSIKSLDYSYGSLPLKEQLNANYDNYHYAIVFCYNKRSKKSGRLASLEYQLVADKPPENYYPKWHLNVFLDDELIINNYRLKYSHNKYLSRTVDKFKNMIKANTYVSNESYLDSESNIYISIGDIEYRVQTYDNNDLTIQESSIIYDLVHKIKPILFDLENEYKLTE